MLFRICPYSYAEETFSSEPFTLEAVDGRHEFVGVAVAAWLRSEALFTRGAVSSERQDVGYAHEMEVLKLELDLLRRGSSADQVRNDLHLEFRQDCAAYRAFADSAPHEPPFVAAVGTRAELNLVPVACDVDVFGAELHERAYLVQKLGLGETCQRRYYLQRGVGSGAGGDYFRDFHSISCGSLCRVSCGRSRSCRRGRSR